MQRQQVLYLWLAEGALDTGTIAWAFYDGTQVKVPLYPVASRRLLTVLLLWKGLVFTAISSPIPNSARCRAWCKLSAQRIRFCAIN